MDDGGRPEVLPREQVVLEVAGRVVEGVAVAVGELAHDRGFDDHAEGVEGDRLAVAVRWAQSIIVCQSRCEHSGNRHLEIAYSDRDNLGAMRTCL